MNKYRIAKELLRVAKSLVGIAAVDFPENEVFAAEFQKLMDIRMKRRSYDSWGNDGYSLLFWDNDRGVVMEFRDKRGMNWDDRSSDPILAKSRKVLKTMAVKYRGSFTSLNEGANIFIPRSGAKVPKSFFT